VEEHLALATAVAGLWHILTQLDQLELQVAVVAVVMQLEMLLGLVVLVVQDGLEFGSIHNEMCSSSKL
jgi:hypothetical protein